MDIMKEAAGRFLEQIDSADEKGLSLEKVIAALQELVTGSDGKLDLAGLVSNLNGQGLVDIAQSWLGNGENLPISMEDVKKLFGSEKLSQLASQLDLDEDSFVGGVVEALPNIIDKSSPDGSLIDIAGDVLGAFKKFF
ncbi:hypothetical protein CSA57_09445 [candidate division KSB3 bacterium]|nr:MAG: hypothetical protein CSA57_09445 [candidate division KSB3 bacterium]